MTVTLAVYGGSTLHAHIDWQQAASELSFVTPSVSEVSVQAPAFVRVFYPREILQNPLYVVVSDPPGFTFPVSAGVARVTGETLTYSSTMC